jgi:hypothetical protein
MGSTKRLSGLNWYCRCNIRLLHLGQSIVATAPGVAAPAGVVSFAAANGILQSVITWTDPAVEDLFIVVYAYGPHSPGRLGKKQQSTFRKADFSASATTTVTGLFPGTYTFFAYMCDLNTGLMSPVVSDTAVITAS